MRIFLLLCLIVLLPPSISSARDINIEIQDRERQKKHEDMHQVIKEQLSKLESDMLKQLRAQKKTIKKQKKDIEQQEDEIYEQGIDIATLQRTISEQRRTFEAQQQEIYDLHAHISSFKSSLYQATKKVQDLEYALWNMQDASKEHRNLTHQQLHGRIDQLESHSTNEDNSAPATAQEPTKQTAPTL